MERYLSAGSSFARRQYAPHLAVTVLFCCMSGFFVSFRNLDALQAAKVMEMYGSFAGILLLTPLFMPKQDREIWLLEKPKATPLWKLYAIRLLIAAALLAVVVTVFIQAMQRGNSQFNVDQLWAGAFCEAFFLGSIGFFVSGATNQAVLGYMASVVYFFTNIGASKYLGVFGLFQMMKGEYGFIAPMAALSLFLVAGAAALRERAAP